MAFSGTVRDEGMEYTEANMNGIPGSQTKEAFDRPEHRFLVVANKFQTGFDQPLLHTHPPSSPSSSPSTTPSWSGSTSLPGT